MELGKFWVIVKSFTIDVTGTEIIQMSVWDYDFIKSNDLVGEANISVASI